MSNLLNILTAAISLFVGIGGTSVFFLKISKRKENAQALMSEIDAMKQKLAYYDAVFSSMEEKLKYYADENQRLLEIITKKCSKCKNL